MKKNKNLSLKTKVIILFIEYFVFFGVSSVLYNLTISFLEVDRFYPWFFRLFIYLVYYVFVEFYLNKTLCMSIFGVSISNRKKGHFSSSFLKYSLLALFDRFLFLIFYMFGVLLNYDKGILLSEKYSGLRWEKQ